MPVAGLSEYHRTLLGARARALRRADATVELMLDVLGDASSEIMAILDIMPKQANPVTRALLSGKLGRIQDRMVALGEEYNEIVSGAARDTIVDLTRTRAAATQQLGEANNRAIRASFTAVPEAALRVWATRIDAYGLKISGRLWAESQMNLIQRTIGASIARGESAGKLARKLEAYLDPAARGGAKRIVHLGDAPVAHQATRLAITEINNTYWETSAISAAQSTVVEAQQWNLSGRHPRTDECDALAWSNSYDLGPGVYPSGSMPSKPHPHCLCYAQDVIRDPADWGKPKRDYGPPRMNQIDRRALADAPAAVRARITGDTFTPEELRTAVQGMGAGQRGHLTPRYVDRMLGQWSTGTRAVGGGLSAFSEALGAAVAGAPKRAIAVGEPPPPKAPPPTRARMPAQRVVARTAATTAAEAQGIPRPAPRPLAFDAKGHAVIDANYWDAMGASAEERTEYARSLRAWKGDAYHAVREFQQNGGAGVRLRAPGYDPALAARHAENLEAFVAKSPKYTGGDIWRGTALSPSQMEALVPGARLQLGSMASASTDRRMAVEHALSRSDPAIVRISNNKSGVSIRNDPSQLMPGIDAEEEVLLPSRASYRVVSRGVTRAGGREIPEIVLEEE